MRKTKTFFSRFLVFMLAALMVVGMVPLSAFATEPEGSAKVDLPTYVKNNNGKLCYYSTFDKPVDDKSGSIYYKSDFDIGTELQLAKKDNIIKVENGKVIMQCNAPGDPYVNFSNTIIKPGDVINVEFDFTSNAPIGDTSGDKKYVQQFIQFIDRSGVVGRNLFATAMWIEYFSGQIKFITADKNQAFYVFNAGEEVHIQLTLKGNDLYYYVGGQLLAQNKLCSAGDVGKYETAGKKFDFHELRFCQMPSNSMGEYALDNVAIYTGDMLPCGATNEIGGNANKVVESIKGLGGNPFLVTNWEAFNAPGAILINHDPKSNFKTAFRNVRLTNENGYRYFDYYGSKHSYVDFGPSVNPGETVVVDIDVNYKSFSDMTLVQFIDRQTGANRKTRFDNAVLGLNSNGQLVDVNGNRFYGLELNTSYRIQLLMDPATNSYKVYVNGVLVVDTNLVSAANLEKNYENDSTRIKLNELRSFQCSNDKAVMGVGHIYVYSGTTKVLTETKAFNGIKDGFAYVDGVKQNFVGKHNLNGLSYYFGADGKIALNVEKTDGLVFINTGKDGVMTMKVPAAAENIGSIENFALNNVGGTIEYENGVPVAVNFNGLIGKHAAHVNKVMKGDTLRVKFYIGENTLEKGKDLMGFHVNGAEQCWEITSSTGVPGSGFVINSLGNEIDKPAEFVDTGKYTEFKGITYRIYTVKNADGTDAYIARYWTYKTCGLHIANYEPGWHVVEFPCDVNFKVKNFAVETNGWSYMQTEKGGAVSADVLKKIDFKIAYATLLSFEDTKENGLVGDKYYVDGKVQTGWQTVDGNLYYFDSYDGSMVKGVQFITEAKPEAVFAPTGLGTAEGKWYVFGATGAYESVANGVVKSNVVVLDDEGKYVEKEVSRIFVNGERQTGLVEIDGKKYYAEGDLGTVVTNKTVVVDGEIIEFGPEGAGSQKTGWYTDVNGNKFYYDSYIGLATDLTKLDGKYYFFDTVTNMLLVEGWVPEYNMYFGADGAAAEGMVIVEGAERFFKSGVPTAGTVKVGTVTYVFDEQGKLLSKTDSAECELTIKIEKVENEQTTLLDTIVQTIKITEPYKYTIDYYGLKCFAAFDADGNRIKTDTIDIVATSDKFTYVIKLVAFDDAGISHRYDGGKQTAEVKCGQDGIMTYTCRDCGKTYEVHIPKLQDHEWDEGQVTLAPTCGKPGVMTYTCIHCDATRTEEIPATGNHTYGTELHFDPTNEVLYDHHWYVCSVCGKIYDPQPHNYTPFEKVDETTHKRTCKDCGYVQITEHNFVDKFDGENHWKECADCGYKTDVTPHTMEVKCDATGHWTECTCGYKTAVEAHDPVNIQDAVESTCTQNGFTTGKKCSHCGFVIEEVKDLGKLPHTPSETFVGFDNDNHWKVCTVCNTKLTDTVVPHELDMNALTDVDDENGTAKTVCKVCGNTVTVKVDTWYAKLGMTKVDGKYYKDGVVDGLFYFDAPVNGGWRYFDATGALVLDDPDVIYDGNKGAIKTGLIDTAAGTSYILNGVMQKGAWIAIEPTMKEYFFDENGIKLVPAAGESTIVANGVICNVEPDGAHIYGVFDNGDGTYSFYEDGTAGVAKNMFVKSKNNNAYYADGAGLLVKGLQNINDVYYLFGEDCIMIRQLRNEIYEINASNVYIDSNGRAVSSGWVMLDGKEYYADALGHLVTGEMVEIDNIYYDFDANGAYIGKHSGWNADNTMYMYNGVYIVRDFATIDAKTYYFDAKGIKVVGKSLMVRGTNYPYAIYTFDENGYLVESGVPNGWVDINGRTGYAENSELVKDVLKTIDGKLYYFDVNGIRAENVSVTVEGVTYWFDANGVGGVQKPETNKPLNKATVTFKTDDGRYITSAEYNEKVAQIVFPDVPTRTGYTFKDWSMTSEQIIDAIKAGETTITVIANYTYNEVKYNVTVIINGDEAGKTVTAVLETKPFTATAPVIEGKKFSHWVDAEGTIRGYDNPMTIYVVRDETLKAVYVDDTIVVVKKPTVSLRAEAVVSGSKNVIDYTLDRTMPEGNTFVKFGLVLAPNPEFNGGKEFLANENNFTYILHVERTGKEATTIYAKAFFTYLDSEGVEQTIYSDVIAGSFNSLKAGN